MEKEKEKEPSSPFPSSSDRRLDDAHRDGWFMRTVMNDLGVIKMNCEETRRLVSSLEENLRATRSEAARLKKQLGKDRSASLRAAHGLDRGGDGSATQEIRRGTRRATSFAIWTGAVTLAAVAAYVAAAAAKRR
jgi:hypothetical protein